MDLKKLRIELEQHQSVLLMVGDKFEEGGRYVQLEISKREIEQWTYSQWIGCYRNLGLEWARRYGQADLIDVNAPETERKP